MVSVQISKEQGLVSTVIHFCLCWKSVVLYCIAEHSTCVSMCLSVRVYESTCVCVCACACLPVQRSMCVSVYRPVRHHVSQSLCVCQSVSLCACVCLCVTLTFFSLLTFLFLLGLFQSLSMKLPNFLMALDVLLLHQLFERMIYQKR